MIDPITIGHRPVGPGHPVYIVAEMSANHHHDIEEAKKLIRAAKQAGADAVKLQTYTPDTMTIDCDKPCFKVGKGTIWEGRSLYELYGEAYTPWDWYGALKDEAASAGIDLFSTPFDTSAVDFLEQFDVPAYKIASFELVDIELIRYAAQKGRPLIISTGMSTEEEIAEAMAAVRDAGNDHVVLLKCTSAYPAPVSGMNLRAMCSLSERFHVPVGLSDHTMDHASAIASVALGACLIEKHFTLDRSIEGPDSSFSLEPNELAQLVTAVRDTEAALGVDRIGPTEGEEPSLVFRRSLFIVSDIKKGEVLTPEHVRCIRPGNGLAPKHLDDVIGRTVSEDLERGTPLAWEHLV